jgi:hypothetical protein
MSPALALDQPSAALCYALQFETAARQYDIAGQWIPINDPRISTVFHLDKKWIGPTWASIDSDMILTLTPSKTERTAGHRISIDLKLCPMVTEAVAAITNRTGPLVINARTGLPFLAVTFQGLWREVRQLAGLPESLWNRDLRAGALTEASISGASSDDRAKLAAHSKKITQKVYDRDVLVSANRVADARAKFRENK